MAEYLDRFPPEHRASADRAYDDGFSDGAASADVDAAMGALENALRVLDATPGSAECGDGFAAWFLAVRREVQQAATSLKLAVNTE